MSEPIEVDLTTITQGIWAAMLGFDLHVDHDGGAHPPDERVVTGVVQITGDWAGAVTVQTTERFAAQAAALLFAIDAAQVSPDDIADTVGELANVVGGNVKSGLAGALQLSLPAVTSGRDYQVAVSGTELHERISFDCDGELVVVTLLQQAT